MLSIAVNGKKFRMNPPVLTISGNRGTFIDSGTTLAYLAKEVYDPFVNAVSNSIVYC